MTGFGEAHYQGDGLAISIEVRTINSRYFKLSMKCGEGYSALEPDIENVVRQQIRRGTLQVALRVDRPKKPEDFQINTAVLASYRRQLEELHRSWNAPGNVRLEELLTLPGVIAEDPTTVEDAAEDWPLIRATLVAAMENLAKMRADEGRAMGDDLRQNCRIVAAQLAEIDGRAPRVAESYRARVLDRLAGLLAEFDVKIAAADLIREVSIFAERSDISEEIVRLKSHLEQFDSIMELPESSGRKLEFLTQEMFRETNTIGSKASDVEISRHVVEIKGTLEKIR
ncbi:MAG TPA: YicC/YloC family endoribonuclease, partial [Pirellulales bacterium]|nr:YicC/YloC family endoribonuclease [Pirellulales bacterium]